MDGIDLDDLVDRLRSVTGHATQSKPTVALPLAKKIDEASALIAQQSLRRHPAMEWLPASRTDADRGLLSQLRESEDADPAAGSGGSNIMELLLAINQMADELEAERLSCVFADVASVTAAGRGELLGQLGLEDAPRLDQNLESHPSPWNVFFTLQAGPLFDSEFASLPSDEPGGVAGATAGQSTAGGHFHRRADLRVPNATLAVMGYTQRIHDNVYDTEAWQRLFTAIGQFPIASVRQVWQAALHTFPTSATLAVEYLRREFAEVRVMPRLRDCAEEDDVKAVLKATLRVLNAFYRHLPITFSTDLYELFFTFAQERVEPDAGSLDALYRCCLRRDVGHVPSSTKLWVQYLEWRATTFTDAMRRRDWVKEMYLRILQIPLLRLDDVKASFEKFVSVDLKGRFQFDEKIEMEKRFTRAKAEAIEIEALMTLTRVTGVPPRLHPAAIQTAQPPRLLLPRRLAALDGSGAAVGWSLADLELELWAAWQSLMERVARPFWTAARSELRHYSRCRNFLLMRACLFPHQIDSWTSLVFFALHKQPALGEVERAATAREALACALGFTRTSRLRSVARLFAAHVHATDLHQPEVASLLLRNALLASRSSVLAMVRVDSRVSECRDILQHLEEILSLGINWMRLGVDRFHVSMVARFVMHNVELLSLTMAAIKALIKGGKVTEPTALLRPFNTFCHEWIRLELVRNRNAAAGLTILVAWKEHLLMMVKSAKGRGWRLTDCGVDELFFRASAMLAEADPAQCPPDGLAAHLREIEEAGAASGVTDLSAYAFLRRTRANASLCAGQARPLADAAALAPGGRVVDGGVVAGRYDSATFIHATRAVAEMRLLRGGLGAESAVGVAHQDGPSATPSDEEGTDNDAVAPRVGGIYPDEGSWPGMHQGGRGGGSHHAGAGRQQGGFSQSQSQTRRGPYSQPQGGAYQRRGYGDRRPAGPGLFAPFPPPTSLPIRPSGAGAQKRARSHIAQPRHLALEETLGGYILRHSKRAKRDGGAPVAEGETKQSQRMPDLTAAERLVRALPLLGQYDPECAGAQTISTAWLLDVLRTQEAMKHEDGIGE